MRRFVFPFVALLALLMSAIVSPASAQIVLAQYDVFSDTGTWSAAQFNQTVIPELGTLDTILGQTFVATATATVSSIQVDVTKTTTSAIPVLWTIRSTSNALTGYPDLSAAGLLSTGTLANSDCPSALTGWTSVLMTPVELQAGQTYALVASAVGTNGAYSWWTKSGSVGYSDGRQLTGWYSVPQAQLGTASADLGFRILGSVPEPSSVLALLSGIVGFVGFVPRRA